MKKLFISHSTQEAALSTEVCTQLGNAFCGDITFINTSEQLASGANWKKYIREHLSNCDAGLFLLTPQYIKSPWAIAEFTAFWLDERPMFLLSIGNLDRKKLFAPLFDFQIASIDDEGDVKNLFKALSEFVEQPRIPYQFVELFAQKCTSAYKSIVEQYIGEGLNVYDPSDTRYFGRRYKLMSSKWHFSVNDDLETLRGENESIRHVICTAGIVEDINVSIAPVASLLSFDPNDNYGIEIVEASYKNGNVSATKPQRNEGKNFSFKIEFFPPLKPGNEACVRFRYVIPKYKVATTEYLKDCLLSSPYDLRDYEFTSTLITCPIEKYIYELSFSDECGIHPRRPEATWRGIPSVEELEKLQDDDSYSAINDDGWILRLERENPPVQTRYVFSWKPPKRQEIEQRRQLANGNECKR
jgi:hypothetical protein